MISRFVRPLSYRGFRHMWFGQLISAIGDGMFPVVIVALMLHAQQEKELGLVLGAEVAGTLPLFLLGGVIADRFPKNRVMICADIIALVSVSVLAIAGENTPILLLALCSFVVGIGSALFLPAYMAMTSELVDDAILQTANSLRSTTMNATGMIGPPIGAIIVVAGSIRLAFAVDALTFAVSIISLIGVRAIHEKILTETARENVLQSIGAGLHEVWRRRWILATTAQGIVMVSLVFGPEIILVPLVLQAQGQAALFGPFLAIRAIGSVVGGFAVSGWSPRAPGAIALGSFAALAFELCAIAFQWPLPILAAGLFLAGFCYAVFGVLWASALQRGVERRLLARVFSVDFFACTTFKPIGMAITAPLVIALGFRNVALLCSIILVVSILAVLPIPSVRRFAD